MYHHIKGRLVEISPATAIVEAGGIGYSIHITLSTYSAIQSSESVALFLLPIFKEDAQTLFGFYTKSERSLFERLISVSGVGGNTARVILSSLSVEETVQAIASEDVALLKSVKGIGAKTAQRIIIDLKDKVADAALASEEGASAKGQLATEAIAALEVLGYSKRQTEKIIAKLQQGNPEIGLEELIKRALNSL